MQAPACVWGSTMEQPPVAAGRAERGGSRTMLGTHEGPWWGPVGGREAADEGDVADR